MKKSLILTALLIGSITFSGCGSSSSSNNRKNDDNTTTTDEGLGDLGNVQAPVTTKIVCDPKAMTFGKLTTDILYAADGDITVNCKTEGIYTYGEYSLVSAIQTLTITQIKKVKSNKVKSDKGSGSSTDTYDYKAGTIQHVSEWFSSDGKSKKENCIETFPSPLPATVTDKNSIETLLNWEGDTNNRISTTCPTSYYGENDGDDKEEDDDDTSKGSLDMINNYTITDNNNKTHLLTETTKIISK
jgi:hypothetical protein